MVAMEPVQKMIRRRRRWKTWVGFNVLFSWLLALALLILVNAISFRTYGRWDLSDARLYALSEASIQMLEGVTDRIDVVVFFQRDNPLFHDVDNLLREYQYRSPMLRVEYVDPDRSLARAEELAHVHGVETPNVLVFYRHGRRRILSADDIMEYDFRGVRQGLGPARARFRGEQAFSSAIHHVTQDVMPKIYFLSGHGERRIDNFDPFVGYSSIARRLRQQHIELETLVLGEVSDIPEDADALIIAGPTRRISQPELDLIHDYLGRSGRVMMLLDAQTRTGLASVLRRWGVVLVDDVVIDPARTLTGREVFVTDYGLHPITGGIRGLTTIFYNPRSVSPLDDQATPSDQADKPFVSVLASSSETSWADANPDQTPLRYDPGIDRRGPIPIAVAVERGPVPGIDVQIRSARLVVFGDSAFASNAALTGGDEEFFLQAVNWLLDREQWLAIAPRDVDEIRLVLNRRQIRQLIVWVTGVFPGVAAVLGLLVWMRRRQ